jgi:hypothetical protein
LVLICSLSVADKRRVESVVNAFADAMNGGPGFPWWIGWIVLVGLLVTVIHEGGHLLAALWTGQEQVAVQIGSWGQLIEQKLGAVRLDVNVLSVPWRTRGEVSFDAALTTAHQMLIIALAGPVASLAGAAGTAWIAASTSASAASEFFAMATVTGVLAAILNLIPMRLHEGTRRRPGAPIETDGRHVLHALQVLADLRR